MTRSPGGRRISIVVPVLDEAGGIAAQLAALQPLRARGHEVVVVDGSSRDGTPVLAAPFADRVVASPAGRAIQMNAGAAVSTGDALLFLHADTRLPPEADAFVLAALGRRKWGRFDVVIEGAHPMLRVVAAAMNLRSRWTSVATGDQAMFCDRATFERLGGFPALPLMEDVALSKRLRRTGPPACLRERVVTSGRRWERHGVFRTIALMWRLRLAYFVGVDPARLARWYPRR